MLPSIGTPTLCEHPDANRIFTILEDFNYRIATLEAIFAKSSAPPTLISLRATGARLHKLEYDSNTIYLFPPKNCKRGIYWVCPADSCPKKYIKKDQFHTHIRAAEGFGHKVLKCILNCEMCLKCNEKFPSWNHLNRHERDFHEEPYESRIEKFLPSITG